MKKIVFQAHTDDKYVKNTIFIYSYKIVVNRYICTYHFGVFILF